VHVILDEIMLGFSCPGFLADKRSFQVRVWAALHAAESTLFELRLQQPQSAGQMLGCQWLPADI
jgi:hypothetical protein